MTDGSQGMKHRFLNNAGFTLIELVIVIMLTAVLMVTMFEALDKIHSNEARVRKTKNEEKEAYLLFHRLSPLFKNMSAFRLYNGQAYMFYFSGTGRGAVFLSRSPLVSQYRTVHIIELRLNKGRLLYREKMLRAKKKGEHYNFTELNDVPFLTLVEDIQAARFQYLVWDTRTGDWLWKSQLNTFDRDAAPDEVRMQVNLKGKVYDYTFVRAIEDNPEELPEGLFQ